MAIDSETVVQLVSTAGRLVGIQELLRVGGIHPGEQTQLKRLLRELVKQGRLTRDGKRFGVPGEKPKQKSGPAWQDKAKKPAPPRAAQEHKRFNEKQVEKVLERSRGGRPAPAPAGGSGGKLVKGIIHMQDSPDRPAVIHGAQQLVHSLAWLDRWPSEDRRTRIVFITLDQGAEEIGELVEDIERLSQRTRAVRERTARQAGAVAGGAN